MPWMMIEMKSKETIIKDRNKRPDEYKIRPSDCARSIAVETNPDSIGMFARNEQSPFLWISDEPGVRQP